MKKHIEILIVEDSLLQTTKLANILNKNHYKTRLASNGIEALRLIRQSKPDLVLSDIVMPEMNGYQLCTKIKEDEELKDIPLILLAQLSNPQDVFNGLECGADNFITKPYEADFLLSQIEYILVNLRHRQRRYSEVGMDIYFSGKKHFITSDRFQIVDMLLTTYETAVQKSKELDQTRDNFQVLLETNADAIVVVDPQNIIKYLNPASEKLFADLDNIKRGEPFFISLYTGDGDEVKIPHQDGSESIVELRVVKTNWEGKSAFLASMRDITQRKKLEKQLQKMAMYDNLTNIYNRRHLMEQAQLEFERVQRFGRSLSMIMFDVDFFKNINDTHGHMVGDQVLKILVQLCKNVLRGVDLLGRFGGEEFAVFLPETDLEGALEAAERLRKIVENTPIPTDDGPVSITLSLGAAEVSANDKISIETLVHRADKAMYKAKNKGRNQTAYWEDGDEG